MSIAKIKNNQNFRKKTDNTQLVIIKGFMGEPGLLRAVKLKNNFVMVVGKSGKSRMKLKDKYIYQYDENVYHRLCNAFDSNDSEALEQEWQKAKPIALS